MSADEPEACLKAAQASLEASSRAGDLLTEAYLSQILQNRLAATGKLSTQLGCVLTGDPDKLPFAAQWPTAFNSCQIGVSWKQIVPSEGKYRWELLDAQLAWCRRNKLNVEAGPLIEFRPAALPDWIWLWEGDSETISGFVTEFVRQVVQRYRGKIPLWHVVHRPASQEILGLSEEEQIRITARAIQAARQADPSAQLSIGVDRPWAEWMSSSHFQLGPLHLCDYLLRSDLGISSIGDRDRAGVHEPRAATSATCSSSPSCSTSTRCSTCRSTCSWPFPRRTGPTRRPTRASRSTRPQWPTPPDEALQSTWGARWLALAVAKPYVRSVTWLQASDALAPRLPPRRALPRRSDPQADLPLAAIAPPGCHRMRKRCHEFGGSL